MSSTFSTAAAKAALACGAITHPPFLQGLSSFFGAPSAPSRGRRCRSIRVRPVDRPAAVATNGLGLRAAPSNSAPAAAPPGGHQSSGRTRTWRPGGLAVQGQIQSFENELLLDPVHLALTHAQHGCDVASARPPD